MLETSPSSKLSPPLAVAMPWKNTSLAANILFQPALSSEKFVMV
jgi:hypothetical protein